MGHDGKVFAELTTDRREIDALFAPIETQPVGDPRRPELADELATKQVRHSVAGKMHLYPTVREHVECGNDIADKEISDHAKVEQLLKDLEGLDAGDPQFDHLVAKLKLDVSEHARDEEDRPFPFVQRPARPRLWTI